METENAQRQLRKYDTATLEVVMQTYTPYVFAILRRKLGSLAEAEDVEELASNVFFALWQHRKRLRPDRLRPWLAKVATNEARSWLRKNRLKTVSAEDMLELEDRMSERLEDETERRLLVQDALEQLDAQTRQMLLRFYAQRQTVAEIAAALHMKIPTVKSRLQRGRRKLRDYLEQGGQDLED